MLTLSQSSTFEVELLPNWIMNVIEKVLRKRIDPYPESRERSIWIKKVKPFELVKKKKLSGLDLKIWKEKTSSWVSPQFFHFSFLCLLQHGRWSKVWEKRFADQKLFDVFSILLALGYKSPRKAYRDSLGVLFFESLVSVNVFMEVSCENPLLIFFESQFVGEQSFMRNKSRPI